MRPARRITIDVAMIERPVQNPRSGVEQFEGRPVPPASRNTRIWRQFYMCGGLNATSYNPYWQRLFAA